MKIKIKNMSKVIKGVTVLENISMELESGYIYGLQGKNGSGKTMLMRAICGLIYPSAGEIEIDGEVIGKHCSFPKSIGALIENPSFLSNYTAFENLRLLASIRNLISEQDIKNAIRSVGLDEKDKRKYRKFSLGMKQRLGIACAIMEHPSIIVLDEPFNALDDSGVEMIRNLIIRLKKEGALIILASHEREELERLSDRIFVIAEGKVAE